MNKNSDSPQLAGGQGGASEPKITGLQILCPVTCFPGLPAGTIIENPTPQQIQAAEQVKSCICFIPAE